MTENERAPEAVAVRELYQGHEPLVEGAAARLMPAVRFRLHRRRIHQRIGYAAVVLAVVALLGGAATAVALHGTPTDGPVTAYGGIGGGTTAAPGYRLESSLGVQIAVPVDWKINDFGCHQDAGPTVVRSPGVSLACLTPTPPQKEYAYIFPDDAPPSRTIGDDSAKLVEHAVTVDGVSARRAEGMISGGRYAGWVIVPDRHVEVFGRTNAPATLTAILDSLHLVDVDHFGCPTALPTTRPVPSGRSTFVDPHPSSISVCYYAGQPVLQASTQRTGSDAQALATALNASAPGHSATGDCLAGSFLTGYDAIMLVRSSDGTVRRVGVYFQPCLPRRMDNGDGEHKLPVALMTQVMDGMDVGYGYFPD